jgi:SpoVK/Ycf46/Vps4 family AAA+-type ATPase
MTNLRKAAEMALKYFEDAHGLEDAEVEIKEALRQALAQPERKWVGLTKRDLEGYSPELKTVLEYIEAILKRKNT